MRDLHCDLIVGARPNLMKAAPVAEQLRTAGQRFGVRLIHTGQHYDASLSDVLFSQLGMPAPDLNLGVGSGGQGVQTGRIMTALEDVSGSRQDGYCRRSRRSRAAKLRPLDARGD
jgi:UDP-N-acetylglucosamine 2-epimerase (non-hydrolysing)